MKKSEVLNESGKMSMSNGVSLTGSMSKEEIDKLNDLRVELHNQNAEIAQEKIKSSIDLKLKLAEEAREKLEGVEIRSYSTYILVKPYDTNPYQTIIKTESGVTIDNFDGWDINPNSGEMERQGQFVKVGCVIAVNPNNKHLKEGDDVFFRWDMAVPNPFMKQDLVCIAESSIQSVIGKGLTERWENIKK